MAVGPISRVFSGRCADGDVVGLMDVGTMRLACLGLGGSEIS